MDRANGFDLVVLASLTAFFKERLHLKGNVVIFLVFLIGLILWLAPDIASAFPEQRNIINHVVEFVKYALATPGAFDLVVGVGRKVTGQPA